MELCNRKETGRNRRYLWIYQKEDAKIPTQTRGEIGAFCLLSYTVSNQHNLKKGALLNDLSYQYK